MVKTRTGRNAVLRRLFGYLVWSPRHALVTAVVVIALAVGVGVLVHTLRGPAPHRSSHAAVASSATAVATPPSTPTSSSSSASVASRSSSAAPQSKQPPPSGKAQAPVQAATRWAQVWVSHLPDKKWHAKLAGLATPEYAHTYLPTIPSSAVNGTKVTKPGSLAKGDPGVATVTVPTNGDALAISLQNTSGHPGDPDAWKIANVDKG